MVSSIFYCELVHSMVDMIYISLKVWSVIVVGVYINIIYIFIYIYIYTNTDNYRQIRKKNQTNTPSI